MGVGRGVWGKMCEMIYGENRQERQQCEGTPTESGGGTNNKKKWVKYKSAKIKRKKTDYVEKTKQTRV